MTELSTQQPRRDERFRVLLSVHYGAGEDYDRDYADNVSQHGLYIRGADHLAPGEEIDVELELPGSYVFSVSARVAYTLSAQDAAEAGRRPGAGLSIVDSPPGFDDALGYYLHRLGRRGHHVVMATDPECLEMLEEAGYRARLAPPPALLAAAIEHSDAPVIGVVVTSAQRTGYLEAAMAAGCADLVHSIDYLEELDECLGRFDLGF